MAEYEVVISRAAETDISEISEYYAFDLQNPDKASELIGSIKKAVMSLSEMPERHQTVSDEYLALKGIRMFSAEKYLIFYTVNRTDCIVNIVRVLYEKREWMFLLR